MKTFRTLYLAIEFYENILDLKFTGFTKNQLQQASTAVVMYLSEGNASGSTEERHRLFHAALDSLVDCQVVLKMMVEKEIALLNSADVLEGKIAALLESESELQP